MAEFLFLTAMVHVCGVRKPRLGRFFQKKTLRDGFSADRGPERPALDSSINPVSLGYCGPRGFRLPVM